MKKVCVPIMSRANYGRLKSVLQAIQNHPDLELQIILGGSAILPKYGVRDAIKKDKFPINSEVYCTVDGDTHENMATTTGLLTIQLTQHFKILKPDIVLVHADRYEMLAIATAASYMAIPLAHSQGGEVSGNIDDKVRNAITMLADIHFPATFKASHRIWSMANGKVYHVGCPSIDLLRNINIEKTDDKYLMVVMHPVTDDNQNARKAADILRAIEAFNMPAYWIHSNIDPMNTQINEHIKSIIDTRKLSCVTFLDSVSPEKFYQLMANAQCLIGNTSSGLREGSYFGTPYICLGDRQKNREHGYNTIFLETYSFKDILDEIRRMVGRTYKYDGRFGNGDAGQKIADILAQTTIKGVKY